MPNLLRRAAVAAVAATACALALSIPAAHAATTSTPPAQPSDNWAGYYAKASAPVAYATAEFTIPKVSCDESRGTPQSENGGNEYQAMMWVGIGGINGVYGINSGWLKQAGVVISCKSFFATPTYQPFWEYVKPGTSSVPQGSPYVPRYFKTKNGKTAALQPGEKVIVQIWAPSDSPVKDKWYFRIDAGDSAFTASQSLPASTNGQNQTAEAITEKDATGLVYLGSVKYTGAIYLTTKTEDGPSTAITSQPVYLRNPAEPDEVIISPSTPPDGDAFTTSYAKNWLS